MNRFVITILGFLLFPTLGLCGGAWMPAPGRGDVQLGLSRKTASSSFDASGDAFPNTTRVNGQLVPAYHDFRYGYLSGEIGLHERLSVRFLTTYLDGLEGPHTALEENQGPSDAWFGAKFGLARGAWPMALAGTMRTPVFYDRSGPYNRYLFDAQGKRVGLNSEWRGVLKHDYSLTYLVSHSFREGRGWMSIETGYTWREGAPADQVPFIAEVGWPLGWRGASVKIATTTVASLGNDSPAKPDDRFGSRPGFNFNDASMMKAGVSVIVPFAHGTSVEAGYNQWLWGKSARRYREPFLSIGYRL